MCRSCLTTPSSSITFGVLITRPRTRTHRLTRACSFLQVIGEASLVAYRTHTETPNTLSPTQAPTPAPTATPDPTPSPTVSPIGDSNEISPPELTSAELSGTESLFVLSFNRTCYCTAGAGASEVSEVSFPPALCGHDFVTGVFDQRYVV